MTDQQQTLREDIAFLRTLAEDGERQPARGGPLLVAAGLIFGTASLALWFGVNGGGENRAWLPFVWPISAVLFFICLGVFLRGMPKTGGASRAMGVAWSAIGWAIFFVVASLMLIAEQTGAWQAAAAIAPVIMSLYGASWIIAGSLTHTRWLHVVGVASFASALLNAWCVGQGTLMYLVYALSLYLLVAAPGAVLTRRARSAA